MMTEKTRSILLRMPESTIKKIDKQRGNITRTKWINMKLK